ncbi:hypothetical protein EYF80_049326 [Liparis tanakae]|uniref:Uncharacterized protein n=1 Tax=Liparis tanakae TaxID=230148 RepID=A0A4Z2FH30_9TELE|nr:hypothetical protein EYF80_049326 [Liparis tanakae]
MSCTTTVYFQPGTMAAHEICLPSHFTPNTYGDGGKTYSEGGEDDKRNTHMRSRCSRARTLEYSAAIEDTLTRIDTNGDLTVPIVGAEKLLTQSIHMIEAFIQFLLTIKESLALI